VTKIRYAKKGKVEDKSTIIYNESIRISGIPKESQQYEVNGRPPMGWIMDRYQVTTDKKTGIRNDLNDWCKEHGNPHYILDLFLSVITVFVKTMDLIYQLPQIDFIKE
jgi:predicted helicase